MLYQDFQEYYPYCVYYYFETKLVMVKNKNSQCIYEGLLVTDTDCRTAFRAFSCSLHDCFIEAPDYLQSYLYDEDKPIFKKGNTYNEKRMIQYLQRKEILMHFLVKNVRATNPSYMH